jgi:nucleoside-diphosphate-sugar epimerase
VLAQEAVILVTGATGFLGGAVLRALASRARDREPLRVLVRASSDTGGLAGLPVERATGDLTVPESLPAAVAGISVVYHCAGVLGQASVPESLYRRVHVDGTLALLRAARAAGVRRVVHVSSPGVLGPIPRSREPATEDAPHNPTNAYERSKSIAEHAALATAKELGLDLVVARPEFVYGPGDTHVLRLFRTIARRRFFYIGDGKALCHPTFVEDAVRGIVDVGDRGAAGRIYHLAGPEPVSIEELAGTMARAMGVPSPRIHVPERAVRLAVEIAERLASRLAFTPPLTRSGVDFFTFDRQFSWERARQELGWSPRVGLEEGVTRTVQWYRQQGLLP